jgi:hypothetical protein
MSLTNFFTQCSIDYTSPGTGFELTTLVVIGTDHDCTGSCKDAIVYHTMMFIYQIYILNAKWNPR